VHRDLKLENFLYDVKGSNHLKLIDFGLSKIWDPNIKMQRQCGTLSYIAPEVISQNYGSQCDLWSLGVIGFALLSGYMPFSGTLGWQTKCIEFGRYEMKPDRWNKISKEGIHFTQSLLQVNPDKRLTAQAALGHPWIKSRHMRGEAPQEVGQHVVDALRQFGQVPKFRRCAFQMMAWCLSNEERSLVRQHFLTLDQNKTGTITLAGLKNVLVKFHVSDEETMQIFQALDSNNDEEIHYSDFLAAMVNTQIAMHDDLLRTAFKKFDTDRSGHITVKNLKHVLGSTFEGKSVKDLLREVDQPSDNRWGSRWGSSMSYTAFVSYLRGGPPEKYAKATTEEIDMQSRLNSSTSFEKSHAIRKLKAALRSRVTRFLLTEEGNGCCLGWCWPITLLGDCMPATGLGQLIC
jgi:calcium-dependent protein kinase